MKYPKFLEKNGCIGFIAPSFGCATEPYASLFESAQDYFTTSGHSIVLGPNCYEDFGVGKSNSPESCGAEINDFFLDDHCDVIISCGGGETMCEDLPFVDFDAIAKANPKWFMGYSDNTNLVLTLPTLCDTAAIYGPNASSFGQKPLHPALADAYELLKGKKTAFTNYEKWEMYSDEMKTDPLASYHCTEPFSMQIYDGNLLLSQSSENQVSFSGRLLGGCLDCLITLCGTPYDGVKAFNEKYQQDGTLWFLEACDLDPISVRRGLWQLKEAGWFDTATGFLIGRPMRYGMAHFGLTHSEAVLSVLGDLKKPILLDIDLGHLPPMMPVIAGAMGIVNAKNHHLQLKHLLR